MTHRALLFTDLIDSTALVERAGDARAAELWAEHDRRARSLLAQHSGREIDRTDGFFLPLWKLGQQKGYELICCNSAGNNAFFVRTDVIPRDLRPVSVEEAFVRSKFRESRDKQGHIDYVGSDMEERALLALKWVEV